MNPSSGGAIVFPIAFVAAVFLLAGVAVAVCRGVRKERGLRGR